MILLMPGIIVCVLVGFFIERHMERKKSAVAEIKIPEISSDAIKRNKLGTDINPATEQGNTGSGIIS